MSNINITDHKTKTMKCKVKVRTMNVRKLVMVAMLAAVATVLMFISIPVPFMPSYIKFDFSELPALIATFSLGPVSGIMVCLVKNLVNLLQTTTAGVGELCNFLLGVSFVVPAGLIYNKMKSRKGALLGSFIGCLIMAVCSVPVNYFLVYPVYAKFMSMEAIVQMYTVLNHNVTTLLQGLLVFNMPYTFIKGLVDVACAFCIYKPLARFIKGVN